MQRGDIIEYVGQDIAAPIGYVQYGVPFVVYSTDGVRVNLVRISWYMVYHNQAGIEAKLNQPPRLWQVPLTAIQTSFQMVREFENSHA